MLMTDSSLFLLQLRLLERPRRAAVETTAGRKGKWENGGLEQFFIVPYVGKNNPNLLIFFRGVETTNQLVMFEYFDRETNQW